MDLMRNNILFLWLEKYSREIEEEKNHGNKVVKNCGFELGDVFFGVYCVDFDCVLLKRIESRIGYYSI